jgi:LCP family protein required for cell wall assembly
VRWLALALAGWIVLSVLVFLVSAQIQQGTVSDAADQYLGGADYPLWSPNNVLVLGSDQRSAETREPGAQTGVGRADSVLLLRVGGGANSRLSIARDTIVDIPGFGRQKINAAFALGGTALAVQTVESYTGVDVNHVVVVSFEDFPALIDAMGGITYHGGCVVSRINGGFRNGGYTLRLRAGKTHIDGRQALALARTRKNACA